MLWSIGTKNNNLTRKIEEEWWESCEINPHLSWLKNQWKLSKGDKLRNSYVSVLLSSMEVTHKAT